MASSEPGPSGVSADETSVLVVKETGKQIIKRITKLADSIKEQLTTIFSDPHSLEQHLIDLKANTFHDPNTATLIKLIAEKEKIDAALYILEPKSFLLNSNLQLTLEKLLNDTVQHRKKLEYFLQRFNAFNEKMYPHLNTPLHYAGRIGNLDFLKWLLKQPSIDVNARNATQMTVLGLLCDQFYCNPKDKNVQKCILELLEHPKTDFNIHCGSSKLPFDLIMDWQSLYVLKKCEKALKKCDQELQKCDEKKKNCEKQKEKNNTGKTKFDEGLWECVKSIRKCEEIKQQVQGSVMVQLVEHFLLFKELQLKERFSTIVQLIKQLCEFKFHQLLKAMNIYVENQENLHKNSKRGDAEKFVEFRGLFQNYIKHESIQILKNQLESLKDEIENENGNIFESQEKIKDDEIAYLLNSYIEIHGNQHQKFQKACFEKSKEAIAIGQNNDMDRTNPIMFYSTFLNNSTDEVKPIILTVELLEIFLRLNDKSRFLNEFQKIKVDEHNVRNIINLLFYTAVQKNYTECVEEIDRHAGYVIFKMSRAAGFKMEYRYELKGLLVKASTSGNLVIMDYLLKRIGDQELINCIPIISMTLNQAHKSSKKRELKKFNECAKSMAKNKKIFYHSTDNNKNTALHNALKFGFLDVARELLKRDDAFLGVRNEDKQTPLNYANYQFWNEYFDTCVESKGKRGGFENDSILIDFRNFNPHDPSETEMVPMMAMSESKELRELLRHPVVNSFIQVKWTKLTKWLYLNLFFTILTIIFFSWHSWNVCIDHDWTILTLIGITYMILREFMQLYILRFNYLTTFENVLDLSSILGMIVILGYGCYPTVSSLTIITFAMQLTFLIGSLPFNNIATYMHMFKTVSLNFMESFLLFTPLLAAFAYSFLISYKTPITNSTAPKNNNLLNSFASFSEAAVKTLVMTTGEFDAASLELSGGKMILLVIFIFFAPIVVLNLINGLAVSDITEIRKESELISIGQKVRILERYESGFRRVSWTWLQKCYPTSFLEKYGNKIQVKPRDKRKIMVTRMKKPGKNNKPIWGVLPIIPNQFIVNVIDWYNTNIRNIRKTEEEERDRKRKEEKTREGYTVGTKCLNIKLFFTLDKHILEEAKKVIKKRTAPIVTNDPREVDTDGAEAVER